MDYQISNTNGFFGTLTAKTNHGAKCMAEKQRGVNDNMELTNIETGEMFMKYSSNPKLWVRID